MRKYRDSIVKTKSATIVKRPFGVISAFADEPSEGGSDNNSTPPEEGGAPAPTINYEDLISKARKEEKDKQYKTIEKLKSEKETLIKQHNDDLLKIAESEKTIEELKQKIASAGSNDSEAVKTLKDEILNLNKEKSDLENKLKEFEGTEIINRDDIVKEVRAELDAEYELKSYKLEQMNAHKDDILVPELVMGDTKEEIDKSIKAAIARSEEIKKSLAPTQNFGTPKSPSNPSVSKVQDSKYSLEYLANLSPSSPEYAEVRKQLGLR